MATYQRMKYQGAVTCCLLPAAALALGGCQLRPEVLSARSHTEGQDEVVQVTLRSADAKSIKRRQLYFSVVVVNCTGGSDRYPAEPLIGGQRVPEFRFPTDGDTVQVVGHIPAKLFARYQQPCVFLEGGGYFTGIIKSSMAPIVRESGTGPNNSFKPKPLRGSA